MALELADYEDLTKKAISHFWTAGDDAATKQLSKGTIDVGNRTQTTAGNRMDGFVELIKKRYTLLHRDSFFYAFEFV